MADSEPASTPRQGRWLAERRRAVGLSQAALAAAVGVDHTTVSRWEAGFRRPAHDLTPLIAMALSVGPDTVEECFGRFPQLGGDTLGRVPGLKHLLAERGIDLCTASEMCATAEQDLVRWVYGRQSLPRYMIPRLVELLGMDRESFLREARMSVLRRESGFLSGLRRQRGLTQRELGTRIGRTAMAISAWERGHTVPLEVSIRRLSRALRVTCAELSLGMGWPPVTELETDLDSCPTHVRLRVRRLELGMTSEQLGRCVGVAGQTVRRWEKGDFRPRQLTLKRLQMVLGDGGL